MKTVWIYVDTKKQVGDRDHLKVFANSDLADEWFVVNDPEGVRSGDSRRLSVGARPLAPQVPASKQLHGCARRGRAMVREAGAGARDRRGAEARIPSWRPRARSSLD